MESGSIFRHFLAASVLTALCSCWDGDVQVTSSVTGVIGSCVFVPCQTDPYKKIDWYRYKRVGYPVVYSGTDSSEVEEQFKGRTSVPGNSKEGNCTLKINNIQQDDHGVYVYVWISMDPNGSGKGFASKTTQIIVVKPQAWIDAQSKQVENTVFTATCKILHSCPSSPPKIEWEGLKEQNNEVTNRKRDDELWEAEATATFSATPQDHGKTLSCRSAIGSQYVSPESPVHLSISYAPTNIQTNYTDNIVIEGRDLTLTCKGESNPAPDSYMWRVTTNGISITETASVVVLKNVRRDTFVTCIVANSIGQRESKRQQLNVHFPPSILLDSFCADLGGTLQCECRVDAQPKARVSWIVDGSPAAAPNFTITTHSNGRVTKSQLIGPGHNVTCRAQNNLSFYFQEFLLSGDVEKSTVTPIAAASACVVGIVGIAVTAFVCIVF